MKKTYLIITLIILLAAAVTAFLVIKKKEKPVEQTEYAYSYECDEHVNLTMSLSPDMKSMRLEGVNGTYPPATTLYQSEAVTGVQYEGNGMLVTGRGETLSIIEDELIINCSPVPSQDEAPFNFGD